ncbi:inactive pancreatic lipase-related protein 1-like isoform X2 [Macrosteles quadrilineatus]|uniref:inactive pancreatic lipase-related protein 1-like isoform X2 n=1 Tax=Macrosteles quadrilineatus TaxID=74068 RepID=UPI0023E2D5A6|nr:inactive pancreatic lipase-related protein 1-like isoform X2 [Macrosteles quadrilineatus]XP_054264133.1 inactive pancreatic lipase-related protein 1-like isoform X2 [Macrosteles quadrilineatus]
MINIVRNLLYIVGSVRGSKCYGELGCLDLSPEWYNPRLRPLNLFPLAREIIDTRFILYTRNNTLEGQILRAGQDNDILKTNFDAKKESKLIIHGFVDNTRLSSWLKEMRLELLKYGDMNVFEVDWDKGSLPPYTQATANTRLVGLEIAFFINHLKDKYGLDPADIHLIGHSLGAHTAGYAGQNIVGLGRITGLDPAGPYFQGMPSNVRLDPSDASYVEVIHTDGSTLGYGMSDPCGHVDFYPNNGRDQPGCDVSQTLTPLALIRENTEEAARVAVACNHNRAIRLFIESINGECPYIGHPCATYQSFLKGECFSSRGVGAAVMGLKSLKGNGLPGSKYFFMTSDKAPYCRYHYRVTLGFAKPSKAEQTIEGQIKITLHGEKTARECDLTPSRPQKFVHGTLHKFLNTDTVDTGPVHKADVRWRRNSNVLSPTSLFNCALSCNDHLYVRNVTVDVTSSTLARGDDLSKSLYPMGVEYGDISSSGAVTFVDQCTL